MVKQSGCNWICWRSDASVFGSVSENFACEVWTVCLAHLCVGRRACDGFGFAIHHCLAATHKHISFHPTNRGKDSAQNIRMCTSIYMYLYNVYTVSSELNSCKALLPPNCIQLHPLPPSPLPLPPPGAKSPMPSRSMACPTSLPVPGPGIHGAEVWPSTVPSWMPCSMACFAEMSDPSKKVLDLSKMKIQLSWVNDPGRLSASCTISSPSRGVDTHLYWAKHAAAPPLPNS